MPGAIVLFNDITIMFDLRIDRFEIDFNDYNVITLYFAGITVKVDTTIDHIYGILFNKYIATHTFEFLDESYGFKRNIHRLLRGSFALVDDDMKIKSIELSNYSLEILDDMIDFVIRKNMYAKLIF